LRRFGARLRAILEAPLPLAPGKLNELEPRPLALAPDARELWFHFADHVERAITPGGALERVRAFANKLPEHAARLAAALTLLQDLEGSDIHKVEMQAGLAMADHYTAEALRLVGGSQVNAHLRLAQRLIDWLLTQWSEPFISLPDIHQRGPNAVRDQATARKPVSVLEDHGWLLRIPDGSVVAGVRRREAWTITRSMPQ
jgi:hypothetical protein